MRYAFRRRATAASSSSPDVADVEAESAEDVLVERKAALIVIDIFRGAKVLRFVCCLSPRRVLGLINGEGRERRARRKRSVEEKKNGERGKQPLTTAVDLDKCSPFPTPRTPQLPSKRARSTMPYSHLAKEKSANPGSNRGPRDDRYRMEDR